MEAPPFVNADNVHVPHLEILLGCYHGCILGNLFIRLAYFGHEKPTKYCFRRSLTNSIAACPTL
jgi:hypothetical protein